MKIKTTIRYHCTPMKMVRIWNTNDTKCWLGYREIETLIYFWGDAKWAAFLEDHVAKFLKYSTYSYHAM